ncbi:MAG: class I SAM-dependent methyltransferase [Chitinophagaceae bacterium]|nr:MAG: class I SAM-dependent methyltransferase [Chitinophagaceae bacterium]
MDNKLAYDRTVVFDESKLREEHRQVLEWVGSNKSVLEIGCHTGYFSAVLSQKSNTVTGVEIYEPALEKAKPYLKQAVLGNIEHEEVWNQVSQSTYDVILFMHVLEHLVAPEIILQKFKQLLKPNGIIIVCLPNINNWHNRVDMLKGNFTYTEQGIMDKTHLKFYNYFSARKLLEDAGLQVLGYSGVSWRVRFKIVPDRWVATKINDVFNNLLLKILSPNITDKVTMYKAGLKN